MDVEIVRFLTIALCFPAGTALATGLIIMGVSIAAKNAVTLTVGFAMAMPSAAILLGMLLYHPNSNLLFGQVILIIIAAIVAVVYLAAYKNISSKQNKATQPSEAVATDAAG